MEERSAMEEDEIIYLASKAFDKKWDFETLKYGDDLYGREDIADDIWTYVEYIEEIGVLNFKELYKDNKLYF